MQWHSTFIPHLINASDQRDLLRWSRGMSLPLRLHLGDGHRLAVGVHVAFERDDHVDPSLSLERAQSNVIEKPAIL